MADQGTEQQTPPVLSLLEDVTKAVRAHPTGWVRAVVVIQTEDGNFLEATSGEGLEGATLAARLAMGGEPLDDDDLDVARRAVGL